MCTYIEPSRVRITAVVATPALAEQRDPYAKGDIKHTNIYHWQEEKAEKAKAVEKAKIAAAASSSGGMS